MNRKALIIFITITLITTSLFSLSKEQINQLLDTNYNELAYQCQNDYEEGNFDAYIEKLLILWQLKNNDIEVLIALANWYAEQNEPELSSKFLREILYQLHFDFSFMEENTEFYDKVRDNEVFAERWNDIQGKLEMLKKVHGEVKFINVPTQMKYRVILPDNYDPKRKYKAIIGMHGYGAHTESYTQIFRWITDRDMIYIAPQAPYAWEMDTRLRNGYSWNRFTYGDDYLMNSVKLSSEYMVELSKQIKKDYNISKIYLSGFSQGGYMTLETGIRYYKNFDGLICFGGWLFDEFTEKELLAAKKIPVLIVHGDTDTVVKYGDGVNAYERLKSIGYNVEMFTFEGAHTVPQAAVEKMADWIEVN